MLDSQISWAYKFSPSVKNQRFLPPPSSEGAKGQLSLARPYGSIPEPKITQGAFRPLHDESIYFSLAKVFSMKRSFMMRQRWWLPSPISSSPA